MHYVSSHEESLHLPPKVTAFGTMVPPEPHFSSNSNISIFTIEANGLGFFINKERN